MALAVTARVLDRHPVHHRPVHNDPVGEAVGVDCPVLPTAPRLRVGVALDQKVQAVVEAADALRLCPRATPIARRAPSAQRGST